MTHIIAALILAMNAPNTQITYADGSVIYVRLNDGPTFVAGLRVSAVWPKAACIRP